MEFSRFHPLRSWRATGPYPPRLVWCYLYLGRYWVEIQQISFRRANYCVFDTKQAEMAVYAETILLPFRLLIKYPTQDDEAKWVAKVMELRNLDWKAA